MIENINIDGSNVTAELHALMYDYVYGYSGVFNYGQKLAYEIVSNNEIRIKDGLLINQGRFMRVVTGSYEAISIENGTSGVNRIDLIVARFETDGIIERHSIRVIKGTGTAEPTPTKGNTFAGATVNEMPLYAVHLTGLTVTSVVPKFTLIESVHDHRSQLSNPNLLINGDFKVWQRGEELTVGTGKYCADRWKIYCPTGTVQFKKVDNGLKIVSVSNNSTLNILQVIEHDERLEGVKGIFSYSVNDVITKIPYTLSNSYGTEKHIEMKNIAELKTGDVVNWAKFEIGEIATPFVPKTYGEELALCRRYYVNVFEATLPTTISTKSGEFYLFYQNWFRIKPTFKTISLALYLPNTNEYPGITTATIYKYKDGITTLQSSGVTGDQIILPYSCYFELDAEIY